MSLISALIALMKSCRLWWWKTEPKQQVEQEQDVERINEYFLKSSVSQKGCSKTKQA